MTAELYCLLLPVSSHMSEVDVSKVCDHVYSSICQPSVTLLEFLVSTPWLKVAVKVTGHIDEGFQCKILSRNVET
jgi:hypothetical protein